MGRNLQREFGQEPQVIITTALLEGLDGVQKMSKSLNNYIGIDEEPNEMFGKVMSISDELMWRYYELLTDLTMSETEELKADCESGAVNPRDAKVRLAKLIIADFHSEAAAAEAENEFNKRFVQKEVPDEVEERSMPRGSYKLADLMTETALAASKGEARRLIEQGGVKVHGEKATSASADVTVDFEGVLIQVGKRRFLRLIAG